MKNELLSIIEYLEKDRGLDKGTVASVVEQAIETAARKIDNMPPRISVQINEESGDINAYSDVLVVEDDSPELNIDTDEDVETNILSTNTPWGISNVKKHKPEAELGQVVRIPLDIDDFGRIPAQVARQVILQRLREAEREKILNEYSNKIGDLVNGMVSKYERGNLIVDIGKTEAILPRSEQSPSEKYRPGDRLNAIVFDVRDSEEDNVPRVILSRAATGLVRRLFEIEVPEIYDGFVEIKNIAREAGYRTKISVVSYDPKIDSVGACVGIRGSRVRTIVQELNGERIDIVRWSDSIEEYVANALQPVELVNVFADPDSEKILVVVPDDQISLAIGKSGQNIRLTSKLLGWKVDVVKQTEADRVAAEHGVDISDEKSVSSIFEPLPETSDAKPADSPGEKPSSIFATDEEFETATMDNKSKAIKDIKGISPKQNDHLAKAGITTVQQLVSAEKETLLGIPGIGEKTLDKILSAVKADK